MIEVAGVSKRFGSQVAVSDLSFTAVPGTVTGFVGANGAGKTTTLKVLLGLVRPDAGVATIAGRRYRDLQSPRRAVGVLLESIGAHPGRSGRDHLHVLARSADLPASSVERVLNLVELGRAAHQQVGGYSLGMRQRLGLAGALLGDPDVLVLDEPANGLDPPGIAWLRGVVRELAAEGRTVLLSSHLLAQLEQTIDRVVVIASGRLLYEGSLEDLLRASARAVEVRSPAADVLAETLDQHGAAVEHAEPGRLIVTGLAPEDVGRIAADAGLTISGLRVVGGDLEEAFFELTTGPAGGEATEDDQGLETPTNREQSR